MLPAFSTDLRPLPKIVVEKDQSEDQLFQEIETTQTINDHSRRIISQYRHSTVNTAMMKTILNEQEFHLAEIKKNCLRAQKTICSYLGSQGEELSDLAFSHMVRNSIPPNIYPEIRVTTLSYYFFIYQKLKARKIELIRTMNIPPLLDSATAFFSLLFVTDSVYKESINPHLLMKGILASSELVGDPDNGILPNIAAQQDFQKQIIAAYWSGKSIEIIVPYDYSEDGVIILRNESDYLTLNINSGKALCSFFPNS